jgi:16S rRNA (adenine1518-N6/adenine1519-N6)-dimethyltransferase
VSGERPRPKKSLGQNFLQDPALIRRLTAAVEAGPGDFVLEYGCGTGALTRPLAASGARLVGVEVDRELLRILMEDPALEGVIWREDGLEANPPSRLAREFGVGRIKLVGNLPYQLSSTALFGAVEDAGCVERVLFMLQREVAERIQTGPGSRRYGILPALVQARFSVEKVLDAGSGAFFPPPGVRSRALLLRPLERPRVDPQLWPRYREMVKLLFRERRKQLRPVLKKIYAAEAGHLLERLASEGMDLSRRPETLAIEELAALTAALPPVQR